jgi:hypothetical protein
MVNIGNGNLFLSLCPIKRVGAGGMGVTPEYEQGGRGHHPHPLEIKTGGGGYAMGGGEVSVRRL